MIKKFLEALTLKLVLILVVATALMFYLSVMGVIFHIADTCDCLNSQLNSL